MATTPPSGPTPPPDGGRLPWLDTAGGPSGSVAVPSPIGGTVIRWLVGIGVLILVAVGAFLFGGSRNQPRPHVPSLATTSLAPARPSIPPGEIPQPTTGPLTPPALRGAPSHVVETAPALARAGAEQARRLQDASPPENMLHLRPDQVRAVRQIAREARSNAGRKASPRPEVRQAYAPSVGASGHVVQLGAYHTVAEAEAAAALFRYKYRGLLATLPKAVLPFRPKNSRSMIYRVQFITPSQAYAEVTCQRLRGAAKTCLVVY